MLTNTGRSFVSNKNLKLSLSTRQTMDVDDRIKRRATRFANLSIFRGREPGSESVPDLCASLWRPPYVLYMPRHAMDQSIPHTRVRRASIYAGMSAYGFINMQPSTERRVGTIYRADYPRYLQPTSAHEVNSKIDNQTLIRSIFTLVSIKLFA